MDRIEAMTLLSEIKHYLTAGNPVWDVDEIAEACDMAIEALSAEAEQVTGKLNKRDDSLLTEDSDACKEQKSKLDLISIQMAIEHWGRSSGNLTNNQIAELQREIESLPSADVAEVVRCKDCKHQEHCHETVAHTRLHDGFKEHWSEPIEWCSRGERKGGDSE